MKIKNKTEKEIRYEERMRIAKQMRENPFRYCMVCGDIPCRCAAVCFGIIPGFFFIF